MGHRAILADGGKGRNRETGLRARQARDSLPQMRGAYFVLVAVLLASCAEPPPREAGSDGSQCLAALDRLGVAYSVAPMPAGISACTVPNPVRVTAAAIAWNQPGIVACRFAVGPDDFARAAIDPLAQRYFGENVTLVTHYGTYACRTTHSGHESLHAQGEAIDIAGFVLEDGAVVSVARDWRRGEKGRFLHAVARAACQRFSLVLTPDSDRDHWNHIHIDIGPYRRCEVGPS
jgi:hypothetical protein